MKKTINILKDRDVQKVVFGGIVMGIGFYMALASAENQGFVAGAKKILSMAECMTPGFTEQFQKFCYAKQFGWKS